MATHEARIEARDTWPWQAMESIFCLGISRPGVVEKRQMRRSSYAVKSRIVLNNGRLNGTSSAYTHSISPAGVGFVIDQQIKVGESGTMSLPAPDGKELQVEMVISRCRPLASGWFEVSAEFDREVGEFEELNFLQ